MMMINKMFSANLALLLPAIGILLLFVAEMELFAEGSDLQAEVHKLNDKMDKLFNALKNEYRALEDQLKQKDQQIKALAEVKAQMEMLQQKVNFQEHHPRGNVPIGYGNCGPQNNEWRQLDSSHIEVSNEGRTAKHHGGSDDFVTVRANNPFPSEIPKCEQRPIFYFEVTIVNNPENNWIGIGLCDSNFPLNGYWLGEKANSFAIRSYFSNGWIDMEGIWKRNAAYKYGQGDVIGCGMELVGNGRQLFFTKNGKIFVKPFPLPKHASKVELFPAVTMQYQCEIQANFGQDKFKYDLAQHKATN